MLWAQARACADGMESSWGLTGVFMVPSNFHLEGMYHWFLGKSFLAQVELTVELIAHG